MIVKYPFALMGGLALHLAIACLAGRTFIARVANSYTLLRK
jgi:hypothetical protein